MSKKCFIRTSDKATAEQLRTYLNEVQQDKNSKYWVFINDLTMKFSENIDQSKITYTDKLCI